MNERIQLILKTKNISASKFADEIGVQRSSISHILSGRNNPSLDFIQKILKRFPDISPDWILTGKGSMYTEPDLFTTIEEPKEEKFVTNEVIQDSAEPELEEKVILNDENEEIPVQKPVKSAQPKTIPKPKEATESKSPDIIMKPVGKKIERIIIFYSDKSCIEYIPE
jgi:transcriptional regulator with XRE-family HTH domain